jgi:hypothetical protein
MALNTTGRACDRHGTDFEQFPCGLTIAPHTGKGSFARGTLVAQREGQEPAGTRLDSKKRHPHWDESHLARPYAKR